MLSSTWAMRGSICRGVSAWPNSAWSKQAVCQLTCRPWVRSPVWAARTRCSIGSASGWLAGTGPACWRTQAGKVVSSTVSGSMVMLQISRSSQATRCGTQGGTTASWAACQGASAAVMPASASSSAMRSGAPSDA